MSSIILVIYIMVVIYLSCLLLPFVLFLIRAVHFLLLCLLCPSGIYNTLLCVKDSIVLHSCVFQGMGENYSLHKCNRPMLY